MCDLKREKLGRGDYEHNMVFAPLLSRTREAFRGSDLHVQLALDHGQLPCYLKRIEL
jgi:hypothetical protein